jgi:hypothetical protein
MRKTKLERKYSDVTYMTVRKKKKIEGYLVHLMFFQYFWVKKKDKMH